MSKRVPCIQQSMHDVGRTVRAGGVVVFPTDTVYGIGCSPYHGEAVRRIYEIKRRDPGKPLPILAGSAAELEGIASFGKIARRVAARFWPGRVTLVVGLRDAGVAESLGAGGGGGKGTLGSVAVRVPDGGCVGSILQECGMLVGTSANVSGTGPFVDPDECIRNISGYDVFVDGGVIRGDGAESTIVDVTAADGEEGGDVRILREGAVSGREVVDAAWT